MPDTRPRYRSESADILRDRETQKRRDEFRTLTQVWQNVLYLVFGTVKTFESVLYFYLAQLSFFVFIPYAMFITKAENHRA